MRKRLFVAGVATLAALAVAEVATRAYFATQVGPRILLYGTGWFRNDFPDENDESSPGSPGTAEYIAARDAHRRAESRPDSVTNHTKLGAGYTKFFPHETKTTRDVDTDERIPVAINAHGFRGHEFEVEKPEGTIRVLTLGASSTFGFYDRDEETYPFQLEQILNERWDGDQRFEVINLAIPHSSSGMIAALFDAEGLRLDPDVVTYYQGRNDSVLRLQTEGILDKLYLGLLNRLVLLAKIDAMVVGGHLSPTGTSLEFERYVAEVTESYLGNVTHIAEACKQRGIHFVVANQQATGLSPLPRAAPAREPLRGVTYEDEVGEIRRRMDAGEEITSFQYSLAVHAQLMQALEDWAAARHQPFVDVISVLDPRRDLLLSWVHLHPEANRMIARSLADKILELVRP